MKESPSNLDFYRKADEKINPPDKIKTSASDLFMVVFFFLIMLLILLAIVTTINKAKSHFYEEVIYNNNGIKFVEAKNYLSGSIFNKDAVLIEDDQFTIIKSSIFSDEIVTLPYRKIKEVNLEESSFVYKLKIEYGEGFLGTKKETFYLYKEVNFDTLDSFLIINKDKFIYTNKKTIF